MASKKDLPQTDTATYDKLGQSDTKQKAVKDAFTHGKGIVRTPKEAKDAAWWGRRMTWPR